MRLDYLTMLVLAGASLLGGVAGVVGTFAVLRRRALVGDVLAHAALPGLCLAFLVLGAVHFTGLMIGALVSGLVGLGLVTLVCRTTRTKEDAALGIVLSTFFGIGIVLLSVVQQRATGGQAGLTSYIFGQASMMVRQDVYLIAAVATVALAAIALLYKEMKLLSFDPGFARAQGWPTLWLDLGLMGILALVTVIGLPAVGVVLMAAMLILPGAAARFWTDRLGAMLLLAGAIGAGSAAVATLLSAGVVQSWIGFDPFAFGDRSVNLPTGPLIVVCGTAALLFSVLAAPRRGVLAAMMQTVRLRRRTAMEHLLSTLHELSEGKPAIAAGVAFDEVLRRRAWRPWHARMLLWRASRGGLVECRAGAVRLTRQGTDYAANVVRAHRLWELYLIHGVHIAPDHVHRDADAIEHLLPPEVIERLENELVGTGKMPGPVHGDDS
ncbi:MAG: metal ABC transporter permease [Patescibacteria group bacterium]|nr:metal ABC transporter permease [Patescibacteria group bacterium]